MVAPGKEIPILLYCSWCKTISMILSLKNCSNSGRPIREKAPNSGSIGQLISVSFSSIVFSSISSFVFSVVIGTVTSKPASSADFFSASFDSHDIIRLTLSNESIDTFIPPVSHFP